MSLQLDYNQQPDQRPTPDVAPQATQAAAPMVDPFSTMESWKQNPDQLKQMSDALQSGLSKGLPLSQLATASEPTAVPESVYVSAMPQGNFLDQKFREMLGIQDPAAQAPTPEGPEPGYEAVQAVRLPDENDTQFYDRVRSDYSKYKTDKALYGQARTIGQATFGLTSQIPAISEFEYGFQRKYPEELAGVEATAVVGNLAAFPITGPGLAFKYGLGALRVGQAAFFAGAARGLGGVATSALGGLPGKGRAVAGALEWLGQKFGQRALRSVSPELLAKAEEAISAVGGKFLPNGTVYIPAGAITAGGEKTTKALEALKALREAVGSSKKIKVIQQLVDPSKLAPQLAHAGVVGAGVGAAHNVPGAMLSPTEYERDYYKENMGESALHGGAFVAGLATVGYMGLASARYLLGGKGGGAPPVPPRPGAPVPPAPRPGSPTVVDVPFEVVPLSTPRPILGSRGGLSIPAKPRAIGATTAPASIRSLTPNAVRLPGAAATPRTADLVEQAISTLRTVNDPKMAEAGLQALGRIQAMPPPLDPASEQLYQQGIEADLMALRDLLDADQAELQNLIGMDPLELIANPQFGAETAPMIHTVRWGLGVLSAARKSGVGLTEEMELTTLPVVDPVSVGTRIALLGAKVKEKDPTAAVGPPPELLATRPGLQASPPVQIPQPKVDTIPADPDPPSAEAMSLDPEQSGRVLKAYLYKQTQGQPSDLGYLVPKKRGALHETHLQANRVFIDGEGRLFTEVGDPNSFTGVVPVEITENLEAAGLPTEGNYDFVPSLTASVEMRFDKKTEGLVVDPDATRLRQPVRDLIRASLRDGVTGGVKDPTSDPVSYITLLRKSPPITPERVLESLETLDTLEADLLAKSSNIAREAVKEALPGAQDWEISREHARLQWEVDSLKALMQAERANLIRRGLRQTRQGDALGNLIAHAKDPDIAPIWQSKLVKAVEDSPQKKFTPEQAKAMLIKTSGHPAIVEALGLEELFPHENFKPNERAEALLRQDGETSKQYAKRLWASVKAGEISEAQLQEALKKQQKIDNTRKPNPVAEFPDGVQVYESEGGQGIIVVNGKQDAVTHDPGSMGGVEHSGVDAAIHHVAINGHRFGTRAADAARALERERGDEPKVDYKKVPKVIYKSDLLDALREREVVVKEIMKTEEGLNTEENSWYDTNSSMESMELEPVEDENGNIPEEIDDTTEHSGSFWIAPPRGYEDYDPNGGDYRVFGSNDTGWFLSSDEGGELGHFNDLAAANEAAQQHYWDNLTANESPDALDTGSEWGDYVLPGPSSNYRNLLFQWKPGDRVSKDHFLGREPRGKEAGDVLFEEGHWSRGNEGLNTFAHARMDDRQGPNGEKILLLGEFQSSWTSQFQKAKGSRARQVGTEALEREQERIKQKLDKAKSLMREHEKRVYDALPEKYKEELAFLTFIPPTVFAPLRSALERVATGDLLSDIQEPERLEVLGILGRSFDTQETGGRGLLSFQTGAPAATYSDLIDFFHGQDLQWREIQNDLQRTSIPDHPFRKNWYEVILKRVLREAAEGGYDGLALVTGQQTIDMWDALLRQQIGKVEVWSPKLLQAKETNLQPLSSGLNQVVNDQTVLGHFQDPVVFKLFEPGGSPVTRDLTENILTKAERLKSDPNMYVMERDGAHELFGPYAEDVLKPLGENEQFRGMDTADLEAKAPWALHSYDKVGPGFLRKYTKKWNGKVGEIELEHGTSFASKPPSGVRFVPGPPSAHSMSDAAQGKWVTDVTYLPLNDNLRRGLLYQSQALNPRPFMSPEGNLIAYAEDPELEALRAEALTWKSTGKGWSKKAKLFNALEDTEKYESLLSNIQAGEIKHQAHLDNLNPTKPAKYWKDWRPDSDQQRALNKAWDTRASQFRDIHNRIKPRLAQPQTEGEFMAMQDLTKFSEEELGEMARTDPDMFNNWAEQMTRERHNLTPGDKDQMQLYDMVRSAIGRVDGQMSEEGDHPSSMDGTPGGGIGQIYIEAKMTREAMKKALSALGRPYGAIGSRYQAPDAQSKIKDIIDRKYERGVHRQLWTADLARSNFIVDTFDEFKPVAEVAARNEGFDRALFYALENNLSDARLEELDKQNNNWPTKIAKGALGSRNARLTEWVPRLRESYNKIISMAEENAVEEQDLTRISAKASLEFLEQEKQIRELAAAEEQGFEDWADIDPETLGKLDQQLTKGDKGNPLSTRIGYFGLADKTAAKNLAAYPYKTLKAMIRKYEGLKKGATEEIEAIEKGKMRLDSGYVTHIFSRYPQDIYQELEDPTTVFARNIDANIRSRFLEKREGEEALRSWVTGWFMYVPIMAKKVHLEPALRKVKNQLKTMPDSQRSYTLEMIRNLRGGEPPLSAHISRAVYNEAMSRPGLLTSLYSKLLGKDPEKVLQEAKDQGRVPRHIMQTLTANIAGITYLSLLGVENVARLSFTEFGFLAHELGKNPPDILKGVGWLASSLAKTGVEGSHELLSWTKSLAGGSRYYSEATKSGVTSIVHEALEGAKTYGMSRWVDPKTKDLLGMVSTLWFSPIKASEFILRATEYSVLKKRFLSEARRPGVTEAMLPGLQAMYGDLPETELVEKAAREIGAMETNDAIGAYERREVSPFTREFYWSFYLPFKRWKMAKGELTAASIRGTKGALTGGLTEPPVTDTQRQSFGMQPPTPPPPDNPNSTQEPWDPEDWDKWLTYNEPAAEYGQAFPMGKKAQGKWAMASLMGVLGALPMVWLISSLFKSKVYDPWNTYDRLNPWDWKDIDQLSGLWWAHAVLDYLTLSSKAVLVGPTAQEAKELDRAKVSLQMLIPMYGRAQMDEITEQRRLRSLVNAMSPEEEEPAAAMPQTPGPMGSGMSQSVPGLPANMSPAWGTNPFQIPFTDISAPEAVLPKTEKAIKGIHKKKREGAVEAYENRFGKPTPPPIYQPEG